MSTPGIRTYLDFPGHDLFEHYASIYDRGDHGLLFTPAFRDRHLPAPRSHGFDVELLDAADGKIYRHQMYVAYDEPDRGGLDSEYNRRDGLASIMGYFYSSHHCPCHRKHEARRCGAVVEDDECEGDRFRIKSITCGALPGLILYSETMTAEELEATLGAG